ncbi:MAG: L-threonylcarbamoyladenylate synthase [Patescibacteria group bacterium]
MKIVKLDQKNIDQIVKLAKKAISTGQIVIIPSDTAYGMAVRADQSKAVEKIFDFKGRRFDKGISIFVNKTEDIKKYVQFDQSQKKLIETLLPGPFTLIFKSRGKTAPELEPEDGSLGIRVIDHPFVKQLTASLPFPITATSANVSSKGPHYSIKALLATLSPQKKAMIGLIVDAGQLPKRQTSTVLKLSNDNIQVLRKGSFNPKLLNQQTSKNETKTKQIAKDHYQQYFKEKLSKQSVLVILKGDLGTGKTIFAKGIGELFNQQFSSPTFVLMDEYPINQPPLNNIYHLDLYRIEDQREIEELKLGDLTKPGNLLLIEWGEKLSTFQQLKNKKTALYWLQIETKNQQRSLKLYRV